MQIRFHIKTRAWRQVQCMSWELREGGDCAQKHCSPIKKVRNGGSTSDLGSVFVPPPPQDQIGHQYWPEYWAAQVADGSKGKVHKLRLDVERQIGKSHSGCWDSAGVQHRNA